MLRHRGQGYRTENSGGQLNGDSWQQGSESVLHGMGVDVLSCSGFLTMISTSSRRATSIWFSAVGEYATVANNTKFVDGVPARAAA